MKWYLVEWNGREYAKCMGVLFKCCVGRNLAPDGWTYVKQIHRWVSPQCIGKRR